LIQSDGTKSSIMQMRADTLWQMNKKAEALASMQEALKLSPKNFRVDLKYARMLADDDKRKKPSTPSQTLSRRIAKLLCRGYTI